MTTSRTYPAYSRTAAITAGILLLIVYGSLFPFKFHGGLVPVGPFHALLGSGFATDRGDLVSNVLLYLPLGFFAMLSVPRGSLAVRALLVTLAAVITSVTIESIQFYDPGRVPSLADVCANSLGALLGAVAGICLIANLERIRRLEWQPFAMLLLAIWLGNRLLPYLPSLNPHKYWNALRPLFSTADLTAFDVYRHFSFWLAAALLLDALLGVERSRWALPALIGLTLLGRISIIGLTLSSSEGAGMALALIAWIPILSQWRLRVPVITTIFLIFVTLQALAPFHFLTVRRSFGWVPFLSFMQTPRESGSRTFLEKTFTYGALVWLLNRSGLSAAAATALGTILVFGLRLMQVYLPSRSAEITDTCMLLMMAGVMKAMDPVRIAPEG